MAGGARGAAWSASASASVSVAVAVTFACALLVGCGGSSTPSNGEASKPAGEIVADAASALRSTPNLWMRGALHIERRPTRVALGIERPGRVSIAMTRPTEALALIVVGGAGYMKANASFWQRRAGAPSAEVGLVAERWIKVPPHEGIGKLAGNFDVTRLSECLVEEHGTLAVEGSTTVDGQPAVVVVDRGDRPGTTPSRLYVASTGQPHLLRLLATGRQRPGDTHGRCHKSGEMNEPTEPGDELDFSYDRSPSIAAPAGALSVSELARG
ncbi:MAG: hypothetical protein FWD42_01130 [Solirubrobacterales bacterium]|nr:hypothetical protein [Solirubrobacterales bacterium]